MILIYALVLTSLLSAENTKRDIFRIEMQVHPTTIHYGDFIFAEYHTTNISGHTIVGLWATYDQFTSSQDFFAMIINKNNQGFHWFNSGAIAKRLLIRDDTGAIECSFDSGGYGVPERLPRFAPGQELKYAPAVVWFPPGFQEDDEFWSKMNDPQNKHGLAIEYKQRTLFTPSVFYTEEQMGFESGEMDRQKITCISQLVKEGFYLPKVFENKKQITILPRPQEELDILRRWFYEGPLLKDWANATSFSTSLDPHPALLHGSPYCDQKGNLLDKSTLRTLKDADKEFDRKFEVYVAQMCSRSAESLERLAKSRKMASQLLERAKQPDSTISTTMKEFIELRMLLLEIKYAENDAAKNLWRTKAKTWLELAKDKEYWRRYL